MEKAGAYLYIGKVLIGQGDIFQARCDFVAAREYYQKAVTVFEEQGILHWSVAAYAQVSLAEAAAGLQDWELSQKCADAAQRSFEKSGGVHGLLFTQILQGNVKLHYKDFDEAEILYKAALASSRAAGFADEEAICLAQLGLLHSTCDRFSDAIRWYVTGLALYGKISNSRGKAGVIVKIADMYRVNGETETSLSLYLAIYPLCSRLESYRDLADTLLGIAMIKRSRHCLESALALYERTGDAEGKVKCTRIIQTAR
jgi:tetratricopeptide (TPR) repeat protein